MKKNLGELFESQEDDVSERAVAADETEGAFFEFFFRNFFSRIYTFPNQHCFVSLSKLHRLLWFFIVQRWKNFLAPKFFNFCCSPADDSSAVDVLEDDTFGSDTDLDTDNDDSDDEIEVILEISIFFSPLTGCGAVG